MRTVIMGAGALGSLLGGYLAEAGGEVTLVGRGPHVEAIRSGGLRIEGMRGPRVVRNLRAVADPAEASAADLRYRIIRGVEEAQRSAPRPDPH